jgi:hypothetical protein
VHETTIPVVIAAAGLALTAFLMLVWRRTRGYRLAARGAKSAGSPPAQACAAPLGGESPLARYQPLFRLLAGRDAEFLRHNRHCPRVARQWERSQRRIARLYLKELAGDFHGLHREARALVAQSPEHYSQLWRVLIMQQFAFWRAVIWIEIRLLLRGTGAPGIDCEALVGAFEASLREISRGATVAQDRLA